tara:strand:- start:8363 stop:9124 length:762 start_codon:yes stop_codon:yes gene_type:complete
LIKKNDLRLDLKTWPEVKEYLKTNKAIILPLGSTEQHGPTGAIGTDAITAKSISSRVALETNVLVAPVQPYGMAEHHLGFPGTMSLKPQTLQKLIFDLLYSLSINGFEKVFIINGHGGNIASSKAAFSAFYSYISQSSLISKKFKCKIASWFLNSRVYSEANNLYGNKDGQHATPSEIALTIYLYPELREKLIVLDPPAKSGPIYGSQDFKNRYPDGRMGSYPSLAKPEHGEKLLNLASRELSQDLIKFIEEK